MTSTEMLPTHEQDEDESGPPYKSEYERLWLGRFKDRGTLYGSGAVYYDATERESQQKLCCGVAYSIASVQKVDMVAESFEASCEVILRFRFPDCDKWVYDEYQGRATFQWEDMAMDTRKTGRVPWPEVKNTHTGTSGDVEKGRIVRLQKRWDPQVEEWGWYVDIHFSITVTCREEFEMMNFPCTRQALQIVIVSKTWPCQFVPFHDPDRMPLYWIDRREGRLDFHRPNVMRCHPDLGEWQVESHHLAIPTPEYLYRMPSGIKLSEFIITLQVKQKSSFYFWNTVPVVAILPVLASFAVLEASDQVADRMSIVLALLLTMATYKVSITAWMPKKPYLTYLDKYILTGFLSILLIGLGVGVSGWISGKQWGLDGGKVKEVEENIVVAIIGLWLLIHALLLCFHQRLFPTPQSVMEAENRLMRMRVRASQDEDWRRANVLDRRKPVPAVPAGLEEEQSTTT